MPYNGSRRVGRQNNCSCCEACSECEKSDFCPLEKIDNQANQLRNLTNALERKNEEISKLRLDVASLESTCDHIKYLNHKFCDLSENLSRHKSYEIQKLKSELEETKKTLQNVLNENPYKQELDEIKSCKICMEHFDDKENAAVKLQCPHIFCEKCVKKIQEQR